MEKNNKSLNDNVQNIFDRKQYYEIEFSTESVKNANNASKDSLNENSGFSKKEKVCWELATHITESALLNVNVSTNYINNFNKIFDVYKCDVKEYINTNDLFNYFAKVVDKQSLNTICTFLYNLTNMYTIDEIKKYLFTRYNINGEQIILIDKICDCINDKIGQCCATSEEILAITNMLCELQLNKSVMLKLDVEFISRQFNDIVYKMYTKDTRTDKSDYIQTNILPFFAGIVYLGYTVYDLQKVDFAGVFDIAFENLDKLDNEYYRMTLSEYFKQIGFNFDYELFCCNKREFSRMYKHNIDKYSKEEFSLANQETVCVEFVNNIEKCAKDKKGVPEKYAYDFNKATRIYGAHFSPRINIDHLFCYFAKVVNKLHQHAIVDFLANTKARFGTNNIKKYVLMEYKSANKKNKTKTIKMIDKICMCLNKDIDNYETDFIYNTLLMFKNIGLLSQDLNKLNITAMYNAVLKDKKCEQKTKNEIKQIIFDLGFSNKELNGKKHQTEQLPMPINSTTFNSSDVVQPGENEAQQEEINIEIESFEEIIKEISSEASAIQEVKKKEQENNQQIAQNICKNINEVTTMIVFNTTERAQEEMMHDVVNNENKEQLKRQRTERLNKKREARRQKLRENREKNMRRKQQNKEQDE